MNQGKNGNKNFVALSADRVRGMLDPVRRAIREFLMVPTLIIVGFLLLAAGGNYMDRTQVIWVHPFRAFMKANIFADPKATSDLLGAIASGLITVSSLTITLLLLVVQQTAASMTSQVFDQFLRNRHNQIYFGFFVGLSLFALIVLASVSETFNPVISATFALLLTVIALYLLVVLIYTTIHQMRPVIVIEAIHGLIIIGRERQLDLICNTRRSSCFEGVVSLPIKAIRHGYLTNIDTTAIRHAVERTSLEVEIVMQVSIGDFISFNDDIALVKACSLEDGNKLENSVLGSMHIESQRDISKDPGDGIEQLEMIAWTSISTSKSNPHPGLLTIRILRDLLTRWMSEQIEPRKSILPVVYNDNIPSKLMDTFETLAVVSSESMQHQNFIEVLRTFALLFHRLPLQQQQRAEDLIMRILSGMGDLVLTAPLDTELDALVKTLTKAGRVDTAKAITTAHHQLRLSIGKLGSRSTRVENNKT